MNASLTCQLPDTNLTIPKALKEKKISRIRPPPNFLKVLIVDNDKRRGVANATVIIGLGHSVELARSGIAALRMAAATRPDAVLLNTNLGCSDDCDVVRHLRSDYQSNPPLIIGFASHTTSLIRWQCVTSGMDLVLEAPLNATAIETLLMLECAKLEVERNQIRHRAYNVDVASPVWCHAFATSYLLRGKTTKQKWNHESFN